MEHSMKLVRAALVVASAFGCAPLTFSEPGVIDFSRYRSALVTGDGADYLAAELKEISGFESITTDPASSVDLILNVAVSESEHTDCDCEYECDYDYYDEENEGYECVETCTCDTDYEATGTFEAYGAGGQLVDSGVECDTSETRVEVIEDVLDEIAFHYIRPYRL
jgi:hypothetical protein